MSRNYEYKIHEFAATGQLERLQQEIQSFQYLDKDINIAETITGNTTLHIAAQAGQLESVRTLLEKEPSLDIYAKNKSEKSIVHSIIEKIAESVNSDNSIGTQTQSISRYIDIIECLVEHETSHQNKASPTAQNKNLLDTKLYGTITLSTYMRILIRNQKLANDLCEQIEKQCTSNSTALQNHRTGPILSYSPMNFYAFISSFNLSAANTSNSNKQTYTNNKKLQ